MGNTGRLAEECHEYQNCINVQKETVRTGISGTKSDSSARCVPSRLANMHRYERMTSLG